jgi:hypothetical protein
VHVCRRFGVESRILAPQARGHGREVGPDDPPHLPGNAPETQLEARATPDKLSSLPFAGPSATQTGWTLTVQLLAKKFPKVEEFGAKFCRRFRAGRARDPYLYPAGSPLSPPDLGNSPPHSSRSLIAFTVLLDFW